jgi:hypothetical protein
VWLGVTCVCVAFSTLVAVTAPFFSELMVGALP